MRVAVPLLCLSACAYTERARTLTPADVGGEAATITNFLDAGRGSALFEDAPGPISRAAIRDEATLTRVDAGQACVRLVERTASDLDLPLASWNLSLNGQAVYPRREAVMVAEYGYTGERTVYYAERDSRRAHAVERVTAPTDAVLRVYERTAELCGPPPAPGRPVTLTAELPRPAEPDYGERFAWEVAAPAQAAAR